MVAILSGLYLKLLLLFLTVNCGCLAKRCELYLNSRRGLKLYCCLMWKTSLFSLRLPGLTAGWMCLTWGPGEGPCGTHNRQAQWKEDTESDKTWLDPAAQAEAHYCPAYTTEISVQEFPILSVCVSEKKTVVCANWTQALTGFLCKCVTVIGHCVCVHVYQGMWTAAFSAIMSVLSQDVCWTGQGWFYALLDILALWQMVNSQMCVFVCMYVATVVLIGTPILLISSSSSSTDLLTDHTPWTSRTFLKCTKQNSWYIHGKPRSGTLLLCLTFLCV